MLYTPLQEAKTSFLNLAVLEKTDPRKHLRRRISEKHRVKGICAKQREARAAIRDMNGGQGVSYFYIFTVSTLDVVV